MFTGIIEETGIIKSVQSDKNGATLAISCGPVITDLKPGDSISVNGTCLTVTQFNNKQFITELSPETILKTSFGQLKSGEKVNLERPTRLNDRLGGHLVSGHIDGVGKVMAIKSVGNSIIMEFQFPIQFAKYLIPKGSIAVDGISLTVVNIIGNRFNVSLIPHTLAITNLVNKTINSSVNLEFDLIAKYIERFNSISVENKNDITAEYLKMHGYV